MNRPPWNIPGLALVLAGAGVVCGADVPPEVRLANDHAAYVFSTRGGLRLTGLHNRHTGDNHVKQPDHTRLFVLTTREEQVSAADFQVVSVEQGESGGRKEATFLLERPDWAARLTVTCDGTEEARWRLAVRNRRDGEVSAEIAFPVLGGLEIGDSLEHNWVHHGLNGGMFSDRPILLRGEGGYSFPVLDVYDVSKPGRAGGLYLRVEDLAVQTKSLEVQKQVPGVTPLKANFAYRPEAVEDVFRFERGLGLAVHYQQFAVAAGATQELPPAVFGVHPGRWERCWENYRRWVNTWYRPARPRPRWWREIFVHRSFHQHDFRAGDRYLEPGIEQKLRTPEYEDTWHWHYEAGGSYRPAGEILKPWDDMAIYNHWMAWRGNYDVRADWGGPEPFARFLEQVRAAGVRNSLYLEAVCVERRSPVGRTDGASWAVLSRGERVTSEGKLREFNMCPGSTGWREHLAGEVVKAMRAVRPDAVYLDSVGLRFSFCEDAAHDHPRRRDWHGNVVRTLARVSAAMDTVNPATPAYSEFWSTDVATQFMSGCNSPVVGAGLDLERKGLPLARTGTCLFRFYFPDFKLIEIAPEDRTGMELSLFNGNAIHGSWRNPAAEALLQKYSALWRRYLDCFTSDDVQALLDTGLPEVYMNRFGGNSRQLYTLWNAATHDLSGASIPIVVPAGATVTDGALNRPLVVERADGGTRVRIDLPARSLGWVVVAPPSESSPPRR